MRAVASVAAALALIAGSQTAAAAQAPAAAAATGDEAVPTGDPLEGFNRTMWGINMGFDKALAKPASTVYRTITPRPARRGLSRVLANLSEPWSFVNGMLQGKPKRAFNSLGRFVINTTIGVGGLADHASEMGLRSTPEDFGQTLARWGVRSGPYLVLPLLGPSTVRDGVGTGVAFFADPYRIAIREADLSTIQGIGLSALQIVSARSDLTDAGGDTFLATSLDSYAAARSAYLQQRQRAILDEDDGSMGSGGAPADDAALDAAVNELKTEQGAAPAAPAPESNPPAPPAASPESPTTTPPPPTEPN